VDNSGNNLFRLLSAKANQGITVLDVFDHGRLTLFVVKIQSAAHLVNTNSVICFLVALKPPMPECRVPFAWRNGDIIYNRRMIGIADHDMTSAFDEVCGKQSKPF